MRWALLGLACACARGASPEPLHNASVSPTKLVAIEQVPRLAVDPVEGAQRDCRPSEVIRRHFAGRQVLACGPVASDATPTVLGVARDCVERALADGQPFLLEAELQGIDSIVARGYVGVVEHGELATYQLYFDSDPCGGSCPQRGMATLERCVRMRRDVSNPDACAVDVMRCFRCEEERPVETCRFGP